MPDTRENQEVKDRPVGVSILSILFFIGAAIVVIIGGMIIMLLGSYIKYINLSSPWIMLIAGIFAGFFLLFFFIGRGLWKGQNWARITSIVFSCISLIISIFSVFSMRVLGGIFGSFGYLGYLGILPNFVINGLIIWYLGFNKQIKNYFN